MPEDPKENALRRIYCDRCGGPWPCLWCLERSWRIWLVMVVMVSLAIVVWVFAVSLTIYRILDLGIR